MKLRHPYKHTLTEDQFKVLYKTLKEVCKSKKLQCDLVERKSLAYGYKLNLFLLGYRPGLCGDGGSSDGITKEEWDALTTLVSGVTKGMIPSAQCHVETWSEKKKFAFRWETYIQTREP